jgi:outer membrane protein assembly factor BamB
MLETSFHDDVTKEIIMTLSHRLIGAWMVVLLLAGAALGQEFVDDEAAPVAPLPEEDVQAPEGQAPADGPPPGMMPEPERLTTIPLTISEGSALEIDFQLAGETQLDESLFQALTGPAGEVYCVGGSVTYSGLALVVLGLDPTGTLAWEHDVDGEITLPLAMNIDEIDNLCTVMTSTFSDGGMSRDAPGTSIVQTTLSMAGQTVSSEEYVLEIDPELPDMGAAPPGAMNYVQTIYTLGAFGSGEDVFVSGTTMVGFSRDPVMPATVARVDGTGRVLWSQTWMPELAIGYDVAYCIIPAMLPTESGGLVVFRCDESLSSAVFMGAVGGQIAWEEAVDVAPTLVLLDSDGEEAWVTDLSADEDSLTMPTAMAVDADGRILVTGLTTGEFDDTTNAGGFDAFITVYDEDGLRMWSHQLGGAGDDMYRQLVIDDDAGLLYAFGVVEGQEPNTARVVIVCYDLLGGYLWEKSLDSAATTVLQDASVGSDGSLLLVCQQLGPSNDFWTLSAMGGMMGMQAQLEESGSVLVRLAPGWDEAP